jgi:hypothetical protein
MTVFDIATKEIAGGIEGVVRQVPAGIRKRVVKRSFIRNAESAAKGGFRIAEDIPRETDARSEVVVVALTSEVAVVNRRARRRQLFGLAHGLRRYHNRANQPEYWHL